MYLLLDSSAIYESEVQFVTWNQCYLNSYKEIIKNIRKLQGIAVGFNTNLDAIIEFRGKDILELINQLKIDTFSLYTKIIEWKGTINEPLDYVTGLCGCFEKGKASEWLIKDKDTYNYLLENLPPAKSIRIGGQAGIMSNVLTNLGVPKVVVHTTTLSEEMKNRFNKGKNLVLPLYDNKNNLTFIHPRRAKGLDESLYLHLISEVKKNDTLKIDDRMNWRCPRSNRFISTYDPPNTEMHLMKAFSDDIELLAQQIDGMLLSGFHMLDSEELGENGVVERITEILSLIKRAKEANPELIVHLEAASTKSELILEQLYNLSLKDNYWDSIGCNERELVEILRSIGEKRFGNELRKSFSQDKVVEGCLKIVEKLNLKRFHLHQHGCYLLITQKDYFDDTTHLKYSQCFSSLVTAEKALIGEASNKLDYKLLLREINPDENISKTYKQLTRAVAKITGKSNNEIFNTGVSENSDYYLISTPSIMIDHPVFTVGLGDTVSASAFVAELAYKKKKNEK
ncbi:MAG: hypothetical protein FK733_02645 [Asgard group archaeon]|nr:hypothetical protein [Asgard group archaeon]